MGKVGTPRKMPQAAFLWGSLSYQPNYIPSIMAGPHTEGVGSQPFPSFQTVIFVGSYYKDPTNSAVSQPLDNNVWTVIRFAFRYGVAAVRNQVGQFLPRYKASIVVFDVNGIVQVGFAFLE